MSKYLTQVINDEILEKMSLKNRYSFLNNNLMAALSPEAFNFLKKVEKFCVKFEKKNGITHGPKEDIYDWISEAGKLGVISRLHKYDNLDLNYESYGMTAGLCDNTLMHDFLNVSKVQEIIGGSRQIQQYIMSMVSRQLFKMI